MAAEQLEADVKAGAVGLGEIMKDFGLTARKADGTRLKLDDPELDPIWAAAARLNIPVMHARRRSGAVLGAVRLFERALSRDGAVSESPLSAGAMPAVRGADGRARPSVQEASEDEVRRRALRLARQRPRSPRRRCSTQMPNVYVETGAILYELGRQPRFAHDFFVKYQDRVMFGKDSFAPDEYPYFWRTFETADEYFDYYRDYHAFWKLNGLALPDAVLRKLYFENALKLVPGLPRAAFPR